VIDWQYTGNRLHPTQKPVSALKPLIRAFTDPGDIVLDPFCGSGSTLIAARALERSYIGIELDPQHHRTACERVRRQTAPATRASSGSGRFGGAVVASFVDRPA
jgi:site-specific DNA-methyltransferase (adenine-specific)